MQLRDHSALIRKSGYPSWPPKWTTTHHDKDDKTIGEVGTLESVMMSNLIDNKIFLFMHCEGLRYMGFMGFDDLSFCDQIYKLIKSQVSRSIKEIGDLDLSYTL